MIEIPGYVLLRPLGQGGMAVVYLAIQQSLGREVALKVLSPMLGQDEHARERFLREARTAASLHHPHIVAIHDVAVHEDIAYIAMQYEPGGTVSAEAEPRDPDNALRIVRDIASALDYAHGKGVVHRDIKPENILRRADGACLLSDFGIARVIESDAPLTREGVSVGTPQYMSPEQLRGERVDGRSDIYSLGVVLFQLLTGRLPYAGSDGWAIGMQHLSADIPRLPPALSRLQPLLDGMMAKDANARPQTGAEVVRWVDALLSGATPTSAMPVAKTPAKAPAPPRRIALWSILAIAVVALAVIGYEKLSKTRAHALMATNSTAATPASTEPSIAVLPFADLSEAHDQGYFSDGMSEELLNLLAQVPGLHVAGRTSTLSFKGKNATIAEIGKTLNVRTVLEGSVRKAGDRLRVTVQLINVADGFQLWSQSYDRKQDDVFAVQDDIAGAVVDALKLKLLPAARPSTGKHHVPSFETYDQYLLGEQMLSRNSQANTGSAVEALRRAVALDPNYAEAFAGLAMAESFSAELEKDVDAAKQGYARAMTAAERAVALDPELGDAYAARGYVRSTANWDWPGGMADQVKAISLDPHDARNQLRYGYLLATTGRLAEASAALQTGTEQDPMFVPVWYWLGRVRAAQGDYRGARLALKRVLAIEPQFKAALTYLGIISLLEGDPASARAAFAKIDSEYGLALAEHDLGHAAESKRALEQMIADHALDDAYHIAVVYAWTGNREQSFQWLDRAVAQHDSSLLTVKYDPLLRGIRDDPRYSALLKKLNLPL